MAKRHGSKNRHHRRCKSHGGTYEKSNISIVPKHVHRAYHLLFSNGTPHEVARTLNEVWIDPTYELVVRRRNESPD